MTTTTRDARPARLAADTRDILASVSGTDLAAIAEQERQARRTANVTWAAFALTQALERHPDLDRVDLPIDFDDPDQGAYLILARPTLRRTDGTEIPDDSGHLDLYDASLAENIRWGIGREERQDVFTIRTEHLAELVKTILANSPSNGEPLD